MKINNIQKATAILQKKIHLLKEDNQHNSRLVRLEATLSALKRMEDTMP